MHPLYLILAFQPKSVKKQNKKLINLSLIVNQNYFIILSFPIDREKTLIIIFDVFTKQQILLFIY